MNWTIKKIDEHFDEARGIPASTDELKMLQRILPWPIPATHAFEYRFENRATSGNPRLLPELVIAVRPLSLEEIAERTKDFQTLSLAELRWLVATHRVVMPDKVDKEKPEVEAVRDALTAHFKTSPKEAPKPAVRAETKPAGPETPVLPPDIAGADDATLRKLAAMDGVLDQYERIGGKNLAQKRAWLAGQRVKRAQDSKQEK